MSNKSREHDSKSRKNAAQDVTSEEKSGPKIAVRDHEDNYYHDGDDGPLYGGAFDSE
ncbi:MAG: hypothetical protein LW878_13335 [Proteobacteria bacterium]|nr:hypothetical protein [Pseudomonadota bacterium]